MWAQSLRVQHVRTHADFIADLSPNATLITGPNGSGKTSLIEALYIAFQGSSFKGSDADVTQANAEWYRIDVTLGDGAVRSVKFDPRRSSGKKQFILDGKTHHRLGYQDKYPVVLFEPEDLRLLHGSPTRRRQFIDTFISQLDPQYALSLRRYERALKQRNALLKRSSGPMDDLFAWDVSLSEYGAYIIAARLRFIERLNQDLDEVYRSIAKTTDIVAINYSYTPVTENIKQRLLSELHYYIEKDKLLGFTSSGPHRHDILFHFNNFPALSVASRGEVRTVVLALKFLEVAIIEAITSKKPIILLDDVFSELDETRQKAIVGRFKDYQVIVASVGVLATGGKVITL